MEQNRITDKELEVILDYFKQFQIRLADMNIDDLVLKLKENRLTDKEKAKIEEDFATMRHPGADVVPVDEFKAIIRKFRRERKGSGCHFPHNPCRGDAVFTDEEIAAIIAAANTPMNTDPVLTQPEIDEIVAALTQKLRDINAAGPILTQEQIDAIVGDLAGKLRNTDPVLTQPEIDAIVAAMTGKLREAQRPALNEKQIDYIIHITRDKQWWEMSKAEQKEILGNIPFL